jgi:ligand-binding sensor domain-containing protein
LRPSRKKACGLRRLIAVLFLILASSPVRAFDSDLWTHYTNQNIVSAIAEGEDEIYFATNGGIRRYHRFRQTWLRSITTADGLPDNRVLAITYDPKSGDLTIRTRTGASRWMSRLESLTLGGFIEPVSHPYIPRIPTVTPPFGYYINGNIVRGPHRDYRISDVLIDTWNTLWIATEGLGIGKADLNFNTLQFLQSGPTTQNVTAIEIDGDEVWVGGRDTFNSFSRGISRGISRFDRERQTWRYYDAVETHRLDNTQISDILSDSTDVWFGTDIGIVRYRKGPETWDTYRFSSGIGTRHLREVTAITKGSDRLWMGTDRGLAVLDLKTDTIRVVDGSHAFRIRNLATGDTHIWAATDKGLFKTDIDKVTWKEASPDPTTRQPILALDTSGDTTWAFAAHPPTLLVSTDADSAWRSLVLPEAAGQRYASISAGGHRAWIGTDSGIVRVNTISGKSTILTQLDGMLDDRVNVVRLDGNSVWFGGPEGLSLYRWVDDYSDPED